MTAQAVTHDRGCAYGRDPGDSGRPWGHSDAAKRVADWYMVHRTAGAGLGLCNVGKVFAVALADGTSDGVLYDTIQDAIRHQRHNATWYAYLRVGREDMTVCAAASILKLHRDADRAGLKFVDRDDSSYGYELIPRLTVEDHFRMTAAIAAGTWIPGRTPS
jgi:hypothetical protein